MLNDIGVYKMTFFTPRTVGEVSAYFYFVGILPVFHQLVIVNEFVVTVVAFIIDIFIFCFYFVFLESLPVTSLKVTLLTIPLSMVFVNVFFQYLVTVGFKDALFT